MIALALMTLLFGFLRRMPNKLSTVLVGLGKIGVGYDLVENEFRKGQTYTHLKAIIENKNFVVQNLIDSDPLALQQICNLLNINGNLGWSSSSISKNFDLLIIACPTANHLEVLRNFVAAAPFNYLLIEKPVGVSSIECLEIQKLTAQKDIKVFVNYFRRYLRTTKEVKTYLSSINKGNFVSAQIKSYGTLSNIFCHFIDLSIEITGVDIFCSCQNKEQSGSASSICLKCDVCKSQISLLGIDEKVCDSEVVLRFEDVQIFIKNNGFDFQVWTKSSDERIEFKSTPYEINNYQKKVYSEISATIGKPNSISGLTQAITVHRFIESI